MTLIADIVGVMGSLMIAACYWANTTGRLTTANNWYHTLNLAGALLILYSLYHRPNPGAIVIEVIWVVVAVWGIHRNRV